MKTELLIDGDILLHLVLYRNTTKVELDPGQGIESLVNLEHAKEYMHELLENMRAMFKVQDFLFAFTHSDPTFRHGLFPQYKANRKAPKPDGYLDLKNFCLEEMGGNMVSGLEADDLLGIAATDPGIKKRKKVIVSNDKDMLTIPGVFLVKPQAFDSGSYAKPDLEYVTEDGARAFHFFQTLVGDSTDGYPGCPGIGPKKAASILGPHLNKHGELPIEAVRDAWGAVVCAFNTRGLEAADALLQARLSKILTYGGYDFSTNRVNLWEPTFHA